MKKENLFSVARDAFHDFIYIICQFTKEGKRGFVMAFLINIILFSGATCLLLFNFHIDHHWYFYLFAVLGTISFTIFCKRTKMQPIGKNGASTDRYTPVDTLPK